MKGLSTSLARRAAALLTRSSIVAVVLTPACVWPIWDAAEARASLVAAAPAECAGSRDLALRNGKIITMGTPAIVSEVVIRNGRVVHVGPGGRAGYTPCTRVIDL